MKYKGLLFVVPFVILFSSCEKDDIPNSNPGQGEQVVRLSDSQILAMVPQVQNTAFYKDVFLDGGCCLNPGVKVNGKVVNARMPYALDKLGLSYEFFISSEDDAFAAPVHSEAVVMNSIIEGNPADPNGALLYPDGEPRFRAIYIFGGSSTNHGNQLSSQSRNNVNKFYRNGGSYVGSCAGAFLSGLYANGSVRPYFNIWKDGNMMHTGLNSSSTSMFLPSDSPLLKYSDFGKDGKIEGVRHNGGGYMDERTAPAGTEVLARFGTCPGGSTGAVYYNKVSTWAYKESAETGRLAVCGSHPEDASSGEVLDFTAAMFSYALDGSGCAKVKDILHDGECKSTHKIGDGQCHHFVFYLSENASVTLELYGSEDADLQLYLKKGTFAFPESDPDYSAAYPHSLQQIINTDVLEAGLWFVTVKCNAQITSTPVVLNTSNNKGKYFEYSGNLKILSGEPYLLKFNVNK